jgi:hypothetical protein
VEDSFGLFVPLILAAAAFAILSVAATVVSGRGNEPGAERLRDVGFLVVLLAGAWIVVLLVLSLVSEFAEIWDMITIVLVITVFFALLLGALFGLGLLVGRIGGTRSRGKRVTTRDL